MKSKLWLLACVVVCFLVLTGCNRGVDTSEVFSRYDRTILKVSGSADVLADILDTENELLSQSENVVASCGRNSKGSILWFNAVAFDEDEMFAVRKYCLVTNERSRSYYFVKSKKFRFDASLVLADELLQEPYDNENARRIAVVKNVLSEFSEDIGPLVSDNQTLESGALMVKQALKRKRPQFSEGAHGYRNFSELLQDTQKRGLLTLEKDTRSGGYLILSVGPDA